MLITDYRTYLVMFKNNSTTFIIQNKEDLQIVINKAIENGWILDIDGVKELNNYHRFVASKDKPNWLIEGLYKEALRMKTEITQLKNEM